MPDDAKDRAIAGIQRRHADDDNPHTHLLFSQDPAEVLLYLRKRGPAALRGDDIGHDVFDGFTLHVWLWWVGEDMEVWLSEQLLRLGLHRRTAAALLGVDSGQAIVSRLAYKKKALDGHRNAVRTGDTGTGEDAGRKRWLAEHEEQVKQTAQTLVQWKDLADDDAYDSVLGVRRELRDGNLCTPAGFMSLRWAVEAMAVVPEVTGLPDAHPLRRELTRWHRWTASYPTGR